MPRALPAIVREASINFNADAEVWVLIALVVYPGGEHRIEHMVLPDVEDEEGDDA